VKGIHDYGPFVRMAWVIALCALVPLGLGLWADHRFATAPWFVLIGGLVGVAASTVGAVLIASHALEALGQPSAARENPGDELGGEEDEG
jgi:F0F1-type ATP synthase assembly protein I